MAEILHKNFSMQPQAKEEVKELDLTNLIELGCVKDSLVLGNMTFILRSLSFDEKIELKPLIPKDGESFESLNIKVLSLCIESVNGKKLEDFHPEKDVRKDVFKMKEEIIRNLQPSVLGKLLGFYAEIDQRSENIFNKEQIKK